jgi:hypothetical protein
VADDLPVNYSDLIREIREAKRDLGMMVWTLGACTILGRMLDPSTPDGRRDVLAAYAQFSLMMELIRQEHSSSNPSVSFPPWVH